MGTQEGGGRIVNVASVVGIMGNAGQVCFMCGGIRPMLCAAARALWQQLLHAHT